MLDGNFSGKNHQLKHALTFYNIDKRNSTCDKWLERTQVMFSLERKNISAFDGSY